MKLKTIIVFPYSGYENNKKCEWYFWWTVDQCKEIDEKPLIVICRDTVIKGNAVSFLNDKRTEGLEILQVWSVDTCQTWLSGWGYVLDNYRETERIILLPGDIDYVDRDRDFYNNLHKFILSKKSDIIIGDFIIGDNYSSKGLVDIYGTYPLLANWFPEISKNIKALPLNRPRSEFLNIKSDVLKELLIQHRKFAYEQTLNILIKSWDFLNKKWKYGLSVILLGTLSDNKSFRDYRGCIDQIERTERMLSLLWREIWEPIKEKNISEEEYEHLYSLFSDKYNILRSKSKGIMETSRITIRALLGV